MHIQSKWFLTAGGFIFALAGFSIEISENLQLVGFIRLALVISGIMITSLGLEYKIKKEYYVIIGLFTFYIIAFLISALLNDQGLFTILREILFVIVAIMLIFIFSNDNKYIFFISGLFFGMQLIILFYVINIDFSSLSIPSYRLYTLLNPNGIGMITAMFLFLTLYLLYIEKYNKYLLIFFILLSILVLIAAKSRASIIMVVIGIIFYLIHIKSYRILFFSFLLTIIIVFYNFEAIDFVLRVSDAKGYTGNKNISNLAGRTNLWNEAIRVIENHFFFGIGGENSYVESGGKKHSFHNAYLQIFASIGFLGLLPILILTIMGFLNIGRVEKNILFRIVFLVGIAGGMVESRLLNFGSPGNLLFLMSLIYLSSKQERIIYE